MELQNAIQLIVKGVESSAHAQTWADLGAGSGLFSQALSSLLPGKSIIYAVDKNYKVGQKIKSTKDPVTIITEKNDFTSSSLHLPACDGLLMANSLHFVKDKLNFLRQVKSLLKPGGRLLIVEYDTDEPNHWVPWPVSCKNLQILFEKNGFGNMQKLAEERSSYQSGGIYSAVIYL
jgi:ubiquinone/menaquinone biosynthesis C-methylase UbiE